MRHNHVTVTVDADTVARIEERLDPGETVADWMREAAEMRLEGVDGGDGDPDGPGPAYEFVDDCAI